MTADRNVRPAAVAGLFYPAQADELRALITAQLAENPAAGSSPRAIIAPHAGYIYSGPVAASAYNRLAPLAGRVNRVVILGPAHRVPLLGMALPTTPVFRTPVGDLSLDEGSMVELDQHAAITRSDEAHRQEHSLEVHLPFLQVVLGKFLLVPVVVGRAPPADVARVIEHFWEDPRTVIVISSDLSHYHPYDEARRLDEATARRIESCDLPLTGDQACGAHAVNGLLSVAAMRRLRIVRLDLRNSGDTAGDRSRVVGYGAWALDAA